MAPSLRRYDVKTHRYANLPCYLIFDQQYVDGFSFIDAPLGGEIPDWVARADSLTELAAKLKIDPGGLAETVERFNGFARNGADTDFARGQAAWTLARKDVWKPTRADETYVNPSLGTLRIPPFYGVELHPSAFASAGLVTNSTRRSSISVKGRYRASMRAATTPRTPNMASVTRPASRSARP